MSKTKLYVSNKWRWPCKLHGGITQFFLVQWHLAYQETSFLTSPSKSTVSKRRQTNEPKHRFWWQTKQKQKQKHPLLRTQQDKKLTQDPKNWSVVSLMVKPANLKEEASPLAAMVYKRPVFSREGQEAWEKQLTIKRRERKQKSIWD